MLDFSSILSVAHTATVNGADTNTAARAAFPVIIKSGATLADMLREERAGQRVALSVSAAYRSLVAGMRALLVQDGVDVTDAQTVRHAIRDEVWSDEGYDVRMVQSKADPLDADQLKVYQRVSQRISRLARDVVDAPKLAPQKVAVPVKRATKAAIKALAEAGITKAELLAAIADVYAK